MGQGDQAGRDSYIGWMSRGYPATDLIDGAEVGTPQTVGPLFLQAEKVIDF